MTRRSNQWRGYRRACAIMLDARGIRASAPPILKLAFRR
ncbi:hypothetical protein P355_5330 [Burkholderia cenocepacia KC-01]|nr:hypothetical protein P355_5330 [Burkholderia cenocepacia KC-01]